MAARKLSNGRTTLIRRAASRQVVQRDDSRAPVERKQPVTEAAPRKEQGSATKEEQQT